MRWCRTKVTGRAKAAPNGQHRTEVWKVIATLATALLLLSHSASELAACV